MQSPPLSSAQCAGSLQLPVQSPSTSRHVYFASSIVVKEATSLREIQ